jgi:hypothetical protein
MQVFGHYLSRLPDFFGDSSRFPRGVVGCFAQALICLFRLFTRAGRTGIENSKGKDKNKVKNLFKFL